MSSNETVYSAQRLGELTESDICSRDNRGGRFDGAWNKPRRCDVSLDIESRMPDRLRHEIVGCLPRLRRFARSLTGSASDADDLMQATVERALSKQNASEVIEDCQAYLFRICRNLWNDELRKLRVRRQYASEHLAEAADAEICGGGPEDAMELHRAQAAIAAMPPDSRAVLLLVSVEGYSYREVADMLGCPIGTVMSRLARARARLADALQSHEDVT